MSLQVLESLWLFQVWLLTMLSMAAISCASIMFVRSEGKIFGHSVRKVKSHTLLWVLKALTQESKSGNIPRNLLLLLTSENVHISILLPGFE